LRELKGDFDMFGQFANSTMGAVRAAGRRFRVSLPREVVGETYHTARAIQTEGEITQEYDASEFAAILAETMPPAGAL
jgi:hypothetical protein